MATIAVQAHGPASGGTRPIIVTADGNRYRVDALIPDTVTRTAGGIETWITANVTVFETDNWATHAAANAAAGVITVTPEDWTYEAVGFGDFTNVVGAVILVIRDVTNEIITEVNTHTASTIGTRSNATWVSDILAKLNA